MSNRNHIPRRCRQLLFQVLEMLRKALAPQFHDWKDADDWLFSELDITKSELAQIYEGKEVMYHDGSAADVSEWNDKPLTKEELLARREKPVWIITLAPYVHPEIARPHGWGIVPGESAFNQKIAQNFQLSACWLDEYGKSWIAFECEQNFCRYPGEDDLLKDILEAEH